MKCDEAKPHCGNCKRRQVRCDYSTLLATASSFGPDLESVAPDNAGSLNVSDIELTYHWATSTCYSLSAWHNGALHWQNLLADIGLKHHHVLHLMLAFAALHLASCRPERRDEYTLVADYHYERALAIVTPLLPTIDASNCDAILTSVQMICFVTWAQGPRPGEYLAFGEHGRSEWLVMFRGIRMTTESFERDKFGKTHAPSLKAKNRPLSHIAAPDGYENQLKALRDHVICVAEPADSEDEVMAVDILYECYTNRYKGIDGEYHVVFAWLYRMKDGFLERLQRRSPLPLIIYAHFIVLMHEMERFWYMKGWTHHVMRGIHEALPQEHRTWIRWPMASVGWIAP